MSQLSTNKPSTPSKSPFYIPLDLSHTALLLADCQTQIASRLPPDAIADFESNVLKLLTAFRTEIARRRSTPKSTDTNPDPFDAVPLIVHHVFPPGINAHAFISPYNKLASWFSKLEAAGHFNSTNSSSDPNRPFYSIFPSLLPASGFGTSKDEILIPKLTASCFGSSELQQYLRARGIRHIVLVGLTTAGAILGSARQGADLDYHMIVVREGNVDDEVEVKAFLEERVLPRFVDVVGVDNVLGCF